jgi:prevent-host-death family protein
LVPITDLRQNSARILQRVRSERRPVVILQRGRPAAVMERVEDFEQRLERLELLEAIVRGLQDSQARKAVSNQQMMRDLRKAALG